MRTQPRPAGPALQPGPPSHRARRDWAAAPDGRWEKPKSGGLLRPGPARGRPPRSPPRLFPLPEFSASQVPVAPPPQTASLQSDVPSDRPVLTSSPHPGPCPRLSTPLPCSSCCFTSCRLSHGSTASHSVPVPSPACTTLPGRRGLGDVPRVWDFLVLILKVPGKLR